VSSMGEVLSRLKAIEEMMRSLVPLKDQVIALEATMVEQGQQLMRISLCTWSLWGWFFLSILDCF
jgi:hypothetical protein